MKRVKSAAILQTLVFLQKPELGLSVEEALRVNHEEIEIYKKKLEMSKTKYVIVSVEDEDDGSVVVHVKKQYNLRVDCEEYLK